MVKRGDNFDILLDRFGQRRFTTDELAFLDDYLALMQPVAIGLDKLQGEVGLGYALPTITVTKLTIQARVKDVTIGKPLAGMLLAGIKKRFDQYFDQHLDLDLDMDLDQDMEQDLEQDQGLGWGL